MEIDSVDTVLLELFEILVRIGLKCLDCDLLLQASRLVIAKGDPDSLYIRNQCRAG